MRRFFSALAFFGLAACGGPVPSSDEQDPQNFYDDASAVHATVSDLVIAFGENEVAANRKWNSASIRLVGYIGTTVDASPPEVSVKGDGDYPVTAEIPNRDEAAALKDGETVELLCAGASSSYGVITAHNCAVGYHGKRRSTDPLWADPNAIQDPL